MTSSPDLRGIDVALLYQRDLFKLLSFRSIPIPSFKHHRPTRDLLHVSGLLLTGDTLDVIEMCIRDSTMDDAVRAMAKYQLGIDLPQPEVDKIVAFLRTLTGEYKGKLLTNKNMI